MPKVTIAQNILAANDSIAQELRQQFKAKRLVTLNLMSSPGSGKTSLLECTIKRLHSLIGIAVIEGDIETATDAERIEAAGAQTVQINTRGACHLEAHMVRDALPELDLGAVRLLFIENVGNLVCPSTWDLGEDSKVVIVSTTEGDDKPSKYPQMFSVAQAMVINKIDLLPYVNFSVNKVIQQARRLNPKIRIFTLSCRTGEGMDDWCEWLLQQLEANPFVYSYRPTD